MVAGGRPPKSSKSLAGFLRSNSLFAKVGILLALVALPALLGFDPTTQEIPGTSLWRVLGVLPDAGDGGLDVYHPLEPVAPPRHVPRPAVAPEPEDLLAGPHSEDSEEDRVLTGEDVPEAVQAEARQPEPEAEAQQPEPQEVAKRPEEPRDPSSSEPMWIFCAGQWQDCVCRGDVRWGVEDKWLYIKLKKGEKEQRVQCRVDKLTDVAFGHDGKHCQCAVTPGSPYFKSLNPGLLPAMDAGGKPVGPPLHTSCDSMRSGAKDGEWGGIQWESMQAFCDASWATTVAQPQDKAGPRALKISVLQLLMKTWIDSRFQVNYDKYYDKTGWTPRAFITYYAGPVDGKHCAMTEELVKSVHAFSEEPIVVFHFGSSTPEDWTPKRYPQLVLLHAAPLPATAGRSFNFNKLRAMLLTRAKVGVQLDADQFVAPGCDAMFGFTEREITKDYPMPILPAHFLDRTPRDTGRYWARYCPQDKCKFQTARWGHAHPTWTYWALPFISRWLRRNHRDETLPPKEGGQMSALRIVDVPEDEDLLNIATWEEKGTKQWCKYDLPGPGDFMALTHTKNRPGANSCSSACGDISGDRRYHPGGVAKAFYTAHHAVDPPETRRYVKTLQEKLEQGVLPPPIMYKAKFYKDGDALRRAHPEITCII